jgi:gluconate 2-dehydrogenase gamma chain
MFLAPLRGGLAELSRFVSEQHPGTSSFASLDTPAQDAILTQCEKSDPSKATNDAERARLAARGGLLFVSIRLTTMGAFSDPMYGGNRGKQGWKLLGFDDRHSWVPPFGALDRG